MRQLSIIPCGKKKIWDKQRDHGPAKASQTYIGTFHRLCRNYALQFTDQWVVLSAKHGFLLPADIVDENYDVTFKQKHNSTEIITIDRLQQQVREKQLDRYDELIILAGKKYKKVIADSFNCDMPKKFPLETFSGMGYMQQALKQAVADNRPLH
ncbi:hypothetical protein CFK37_16775 [Virgibacillus phasianinus]|uniref:DUF6884 domain-containing protein n=1 Tax=Virgibacillus phasianinus TaxID=2017483 RepID=A0A220U6U4_9BACI|nr:DUF6884 domain-containing protein [Virgibacillus phasianinus]ASK63692.1 hypothetical protein CFK37_16775 [Virgibacillus phasianinus]